MMQGDSYALGIEILDGKGNAVTNADIQDMEITVGNLSKKYSGGDLIYDEDSGKWGFPLTQEETFQMKPMRVKVQARILWPDKSVEGVDLGYTRIHESESKEVLK